MFENLHYQYYVYALLVFILAGTAFRLHLLTDLGALCALLVGLTALLVGGPFALGLLFLFFASSNLLGLWRRKEKARLGFEKGGRRDQWQVLANGGPAILGLIIGAFAGRLIHQPHLELVLYTAGLAEANSDTWSTEIGAASGAVSVSVVTGRNVPPGRSGGVSLPGTLGAVAGSALISLVYTSTLHSHRLSSLCFITVAGVFGSIADSVMGATIQAQYRDQDGTISEVEGPSSKLVRGVRRVKNDAVNFLGGLTALLVMAILAILRH